jgi:type II secretory pathway pseudopilin PulG
LIELMIAMLVLAIGLGGTTILLTGSIASNNKNNKDTTATLLAQMVIEQISAQHVYATGTINITDCAGTVWPIQTTPGAAGTGSGANLKSDGTIDFTQSSTALVTNNYAMNYVDCSATGGIKTTYDVRWNVMNVSTNTTVRLITAAARPISSNVNKLGGVFFALPVNLRGIGGPAAGL